MAGIVVAGTVVAAVAVGAGVVVGVNGERIRQKLNESSGILPRTAAVGISVIGLAHDLTECAKSRITGSKPHYLRIFNS